MNETKRFNPLDRAFLANPYPEFRRLREEDPVHWSVTGSWVLTRHDDIKAVLTDPRFRTVDTPERVVERGERFARTGPNLDHLNRLMRGFFLFADPPVHAVSRAPARAAMSSANSSSLAQLVAQVTAELIESLAQRKQADLVADYTEPLACRTIGRMMGLADEDAAKIQVMSHRVARVLDSLLPLESYGEINTAAGEMLALLDQALERADPGNGFLRGLAAAYAGGNATDQLAPIAATIFFGGQETTVGALGNSLYLLAAHPEWRAEMLRQPPESTNWIHEILRYESPVQLTAREALAAVELRGRQIRQGERVVLYLGAANRDPDVFPEPDRLDFERDTRAHLAFSAGIHRCIGIHVAVEEMKQGITALFRRFPNLVLIEPTPQWRENVSIRGHARLLVDLKPGGDCFEQ